MASAPIRPGYFPPNAAPDALAAFHRENGWLVVEDALQPAEVDALNAETVDICRGRRGGFSDRWGPAPDPAALADLSDEACIARFLCIHEPQAGSDLVHATMKHPQIVHVLQAVIGPNVKCMQAMLFIKASGKPGQAWHQDEDYIPTRDRSLTGAWIALDDAHIENGCLWVIPGSHKPGILWPQYAHNDKRFDCAFESYDFPYRDEDAVPVQVRRGSIVFFNGYLLHRSLPNVARTGFRRSLVNHYMSAESFLPWGTPPQGTSVAQYDNRRVVLVAGRDPHAARGYVSLRGGGMVLRPDGLGGCGEGRTSLDEHKRAIEERLAHADNG